MDSNYNSRKNVKSFYLVCLLFFLINHPTYSQTAAQNTATYPRTTGYMSFLLPIVAIDKYNTTTNFTTGTSIGFPTGINVLYSDRFGFSFELTPTIRTSGSLSRETNLQFAPGPMFRFKKGFTFISRLAFETSGRYGFTLVFNKILVRTKVLNYFTAVSLPARFGNGGPASIGANLQLGVVF